MSYSDIFCVYNFLFTYIDIVYILKDIDIHKV